MFSETPRVMYGDACFFRVCPECGRFVKADDRIVVYGPDGDEWIDEDVPNATCKKHGRVKMPFEGWI